jgi:hypothetical protein
LAVEVEVGEPTDPVVTLDELLDCGPLPPCPPVPPVWPLSARATVERVAIAIARIVFFIFNISYLIFEFVVAC